MVQIGMQYKLSTNVLYYSQVVRWQIESDTADFDSIAVFEVAEEADSSVEASHNDHPCIQDSRQTAKVLWSLHVVLQG